MTVQLVGLKRELSQLLTKIGDGQPVSMIKRNNHVSFILSLGNHLPFPIVFKITFYGGLTW